MCLITEARFFVWTIDCCLTAKSVLFLIRYYTSLTNEHFRLPFLRSS